MKRLLLSLTCVFLLLVPTAIEPIAASAYVAVIQQSTTATTIPFLIVDSATGQIGQTGQASNIVLKVRYGSTSASAGGTITEMDSTNFPGIYLYTPTATETGTTGLLQLYATCTSCAPNNSSALIVGNNPYASALAANVTQVAGQTASAAGTVTFPGTIGTSTYAGGAVASVTAGVTVTTNNDKAGYGLSATGLNSTPLVLGTGAVNDGSSTTTVIDSNTTASAVNSFKGEIVRFTSGADAGLVGVVQSNTTGANSLLTLITALPSAPASADTYALLPGVPAKTVDMLVALGTDNRPKISVDVHSSGVTVAAVTGAVGSVTGAVGSVTGGVTVTTNNDKTNYLLASSEHTAISGTDVPSGLTSQGYNSSLATALGVTNASLSNLLQGSGGTQKFTATSLSLAPTGGSAPTTSQIAAAILATPANLLVTNSSGQVTYSNTAPPTAAQNVTALMNYSVGHALTFGQLMVILQAAPGLISNVTNSWNSGTHILSTAYQFTGDGAAILTTNTQYPTSQVTNPAISSRATTAGTIPQP